MCLYDGERFTGPEVNSHGGLVSDFPVSLLKGARITFDDKGVLV